MNIKQKARILLNVFAAILSLLFLYFVIVSAVSGFRFALFQFSNYWYFLISLSFGFGIQIGLYSYLKQLVKNRGVIMGRKTVAATGTTSALAMISCCAHYLANIVPILGIAGVLSIVAQYQIKIFWIGLFSNILGIVFITDKIIKFPAKGLPAGRQASPFSGGKKTIVNKTIIIILLAVVFIGGFFVVYQSRFAEQEISNNQTEKQNSTQNWETKTDGQANVIVAVTPTDLAPQSAEWKFNVVMNTHSIELDQNLAEIAALIDDGGKEYKPLRWEGAQAGGHHREGVLVFAPIAPYPQNLALNIKNIGDAQRLFSWTLIE